MPLPLSNRIKVFIFRSLFCASFMATIGMLLMTASANELKSGSEWEKDALAARVVVLGLEDRALTAMVVVENVSEHNLKLQSFPLSGIRYTISATIEHADGDEGAADVENKPFASFTSKDLSDGFRFRSGNPLRDHHNILRPGEVFGRVGVVAISEKLNMAIERGKRVAWRGVVRLRLGHVGQDADHLIELKAPVLWVQGVDK